MDLKQHNLKESSLALESFIDDLRVVERDGRGQDPIEVAIAARRWNSLAAQYGFESISNGEFVASVVDVSKKVLSATAEHFGKLIESVQVYLDKSGGKEVDRLRRLIESTQGDGDGVISNQSLATTLAINGRIPSDFHEAVMKLTGLVDLLDKAVPAIAQVSKEAYPHAVEQIPPKDFAQLEKYLKDIAQPIIKHGSPVHHFPTAVLTEQFLGGHRLFVEKAQRSAPSKLTKDATFAKVADILSTMRYSVAPSKPAQEAINPRVPILARHQLREVVELCEKLTDALYRLLALAKTHAKIASGLDVSSELDATFKVLKDDKWAQQGTLFAGWLDLYYRDDLANHRRLVQTGLHIVASAQKALAEYVHVSLKHYK